MGHNKRPNLRIIGIEEEEVQLKGTENIFNKLIEITFTNLKKICIQRYEKLIKCQIDRTKKSPLAT